MSETPIERTPDYARGWCEGVSAVLVEVFTGDFGGFLSAQRGGKDEEWIALGDIFEVIQRLQGHPRPPKAPKCVPVAPSAPATAHPSSEHRE